MTDTMLNELRIYTITKGRRAAFDRRIEEAALPLFKRFGFRLNGFWEDTSDPHTIVYSLSWIDEAEMRDKWKKLAGTSEWQESQKKFDKPGPLLVGIEKRLIRPTLSNPHGGLLVAPAKVSE